MTGQLFDPDRATQAPPDVPDYTGIEQTGPRVPWNRTPESGRAIEELRVELGYRAAHDLVVRPFFGWNGPDGPKSDPHNYRRPQPGRPR